MNTLTLGERVKTALQGPPKRTQRALAAAVGISPVSVNDWVSDRTKTIEGSHLLRAASFLGVSPKWLAEGKGPMRLAGDAQDAPSDDQQPRLTLREALPITLEALRAAPAELRAELAQVLGLLVSTGSALYEPRVVELLTAAPDAPVGNGLAPATGEAPSSEKPAATDADWRELRKRAMRIAETDKSPAKRAMASKLMVMLDESVRERGETSKPLKTRHAR